MDDVSRSVREDINGLKGNIGVSSRRASRDGRRWNHKITRRRWLFRSRSVDRRGGLCTRRRRRTRRRSGM